MKSYLLFTATGPIVVLTSCASVDDKDFLGCLKEKGIEKFVAHELPLDLVKQRYGPHFDIVQNNPEETDEMRVLEYDGTKVFSMFSFSEFGRPIYYEEKKTVLV